MPSNTEKTRTGDTGIDTFRVVTPVIAALEKANTSTVVIQGFLGTSEDEVVRLYQGVNTSAYVEIPKEALVHLEPDNSGEPGALRAYVRASSEILSVQRYRASALDWVGVPLIPGPQFPPAVAIDTVWTCIAAREKAFADAIGAASGRSQDEKNQVRSFQTDILRDGIANCIEKFGAPASYPLFSPLRGQPFTPAGLLKSILIKHPS